MKIECVNTVVLSIALALASQGVKAEEPVAQFSGESAGNTAEFTVESPWLMDWLVSGDPGQYEVVDVALINAVTGAYEGVAIKTKTAGNGVRLFEQAGRYYFRVDASMMKWNIKVVQLTPQEAEQYKPKTQKSVLDK